MRKRIQFLPYFLGAILFIITSGCNTVTLPDVIPQPNLFDGESLEDGRYRDPRPIVERVMEVPKDVREQILLEAPLIKEKLGLPGSRKSIVGSNSIPVGRGSDVKSRWNDGVAVNAMAQKYFPDDPMGVENVIDVIAVYGNGKLKQSVRDNSYGILESAYMHQSGEVPLEVGEDARWDAAFDFGAEPAKLFEYLNSTTYAEDADGEGEVNVKFLRDRKGIVHLRNARTPYSGSAYSYHRNGRRKAFYKYVDGKLEGVAGFWHDNGQQAHEMHYKDNKLHGKHTYWDRDGNIMFEVLYVEGIAN